MSPDHGQILPNAASEGDLKVKCPKCGEMRGSRVKRRGFVQKQIMPFLGYFPWSCGACRFSWNSKIRGEKKMKRLGMKGPKAFVEPDFDFSRRPQSVQPAAAPKARPAVNRFEDDTHEDIGD
jgi:ssDNA-binding Zn-finger/Zn-ribbon topoisomerase 1